MKQEDELTSESLQLIRNLKRNYESQMREAHRTVNFIRPEIMAFAEQMELTMRKHDPDKGDSWKTCDPLFLYQKFEEEVNEVKVEFFNLYLKKCETEIHYNSELIDVANVAMMIWNRGQGDTTP